MPFTNSDAPIELIDQLKETLTTLKKRIENYFRSVNSLDNSEYEDYLLSHKVAPYQNIKAIAKFPDERGNYYDIPFEFEMPVKLLLTFQGLPFKEMEITIDFPKMLFGPKNILPQIVFRVQSPVAYPGNIGLVWEPLVGKPDVIAFHPYQKALTMKKELKQYYEEGIVDMYCDVLNRGAYDQADTLRDFLSEFCYGKYKKYLSYQFNKLQPPNVIVVPIKGIYNAHEEKHFFEIRTWAYGKTYMPPSPVVMKILYPLTALIAMFDENAEYIEGAEPLPLKKVEKDKRRLSKKQKLKEKKLGLDFDPFRPPQQEIVRDEFGYVISQKGGFSSRDVKTARKSLWEIEKELKEKQAKEAAQKRSHVKKYPNAKAFYEANQNKKFTVKGDLTGLTYSQKANVSLVKGCSPPFILKFARDHIRVRKGVTSQKAIEILFEVYNLGYLHEV